MNWGTIIIGFVALLLFVGIAFLLLFSTRGEDVDGDHSESTGEG
jgi:hypothetical protein